MNASLNEKLRGVEWGKYKLGDLFTFKGIKQARSQREIPTDKNGVHYIIQSMGNNMFDRNVDRQWLVDNGEAPVDGNAIVLGVTLPAVSYQPDEFGASQVITARADFLNERIGLFFVLILKKLCFNLFSYDKKPGIGIYKNLVIDLPTKNGDIDFEFMESFIEELENQRVAVLSAYLEESGYNNYELSFSELDALRKFGTLKDENWGIHKIGNLFERVETTRLPYKAKELPKQPTDDFVLPCLTSSFQNQGLNYFAPKKGATVLSNVISIPSNSDVYRAYYQSRDFTVLSDAYAIRWKSDKVKISPNHYLFMVMCINKVTDLPIYSYKNKLGGWNVVKGKYIRLPEKDGKIDFGFMETFISAIKKLAIKDVVLYSEQKIAATKEVVSPSSGE